MLVTLRYEDKTTESIEINRPFTGETIWLRKINYTILQIVHVGQELLVYVEQQPN